MNDNASIASVKCLCPHLSLMWEWGELLIVCFFLFVFLDHYFITFLLNGDNTFYRLPPVTPVATLSCAFNSNAQNWQTSFWAATQTLSSLELRPSTNKV